MSVKMQIILSEDVNNTSSIGRQNLSLVNPFIGLFLPYIPSAASFGVTIVAYFEGKPKNDSLKIKVDIVNKKDDSIIFSTGESITNAPTPSDSDKTNLNLNIELRNLGIPNDGEYIVDCEIDGSKTSHSFYVYKTNSKE